jgi:hypothetical protein
MQAVVRVANHKLAAAFDTWSEQAAERRRLKGVAAAIVARMKVGALLHLTMHPNIPPAMSVGAGKAQQGGNARLAPHAAGVFHGVMLQPRVGGGGARRHLLSLASPALRSAWQPFLSAPALNRMSCRGCCRRASWPLPS